MKISCEKYILQSACTIASRATASKSPIPALEGLLLQAGIDLRVTGYDLKKGIYTNIAADIAEQGSIVVGARFFGDYDDPESDVSRELAKYPEEAIHTLPDPNDAKPLTRYILSPKFASWKELV